MGSKTILTMDIGGTQSRVALIDEDANVIRRTSVSTEEGEGYRKVIATIRSFFTEPELDRVCGIGIAIAGLLSKESGVLLSSPNMAGWINVPIKQIFSEEFELPVFAGNDATLAALGEHRYGAAKGLSSFVYITISTGIGGGLMLDGRTYLGAQGYAGEIGHMTIDPDGPQCACGMRGCFEAMASGTAIARYAREEVSSGAHSILAGVDPDSISAETVVKAARQGDELANGVINRVATNLGIGISNLIVIFDPEAVVVGGGVSNSADLIFDTAVKVVADRAGSYFRKDVPILKAALGDDVGLIGAAALALDNI